LAKSVSWVCHVDKMQTDRNRKVTKLRWATADRVIRWHVNFVVTTRSTVLLHKLVVTHLVTKFSAICGSGTFIA